MLGLQTRDVIIAGALGVRDARAAHEAVATADAPPGAGPCDTREGAVVLERVIVAVVARADSLALGRPRGPTEGAVLPCPPGGVVTALVRDTVRREVPAANAVVVVALATVASAVAQRREGTPSSGRLHPRPAAVNVPLGGVDAGDRGTSVPRLLLRVGREAVQRGPPPLGRPIRPRILALLRPLPGRRIPP